MNLPELPTPYIRHWINAPFTDVGLHTDESMRAYGAACAAHGRAEVDRLKFAMLEMAGAMDTKAHNNPQIKRSTLHSLAAELRSAADARSGQPTGG